VRGTNDLYYADPEQSNFSNISVSFPMGVGIKFKVIHQMGMAVEYLLNVPLTGYLDGVEKRGNGGVTDLFYQLSVHIYYTFLEARKNCHCL
jgi:hypothetical protein